MKFFKAIVVFYVSVILSGCASMHVPEITQHAIPPNANVGLLINVGDSPTHEHIGTTILNNFNKKYSYDWNMKDVIFQAYKEEIESSTNMKVIDLHKFGIKNASELDFVDIKNKQWSVVEANGKLRDTLLEENLYAVITVSETPTIARLECGAVGCKERYIDGYGLFSRSFLGLNNFTATAGFEFTAEVIDPPVDLGAQPGLRNLDHFQRKSKLITEFKPRDVKNITDQELAPVKAHIVEYIQSVAAATSEFLR